MIPFPDKKYQIIYADPPWSYENYNYAKTKQGNRAKRGVVKEYQTMNMQDIKELHIEEICENNCMLFLWVTFPLLQEGMDTLKAWGFVFRTVAFVWTKTYEKSGKLFWGMGNWTRSNAEMCLLGIKGKPKRISCSVHQIISSPCSVHSKKPDEIRDRIVRLVGDLPRIELFARQRTPGWDAWGDEV